MEFRVLAQGLSLGHEQWAQGGIPRGSIRLAALLGKSMDEAKGCGAKLLQMRQRLQQKDLRGAVLALSRKLLSL